MIDSVLKTYPWTYRIKNLKGEKIKRRFYEKELLLSKLQMSYYTKPDSHARAKVKVVLDMSNYATKKELEYATVVDTSNLAAKMIRLLSCSNWFE